MDDGERRCDDQRRNNEGHPAVAVTFTKIDEKIGPEARTLLQGKEVVALGSPDGTKRKHHGPGLDSYSR